MTDRIDVEELVERLKDYGSEPMYGTLDGDSTEVPCAVLRQAATALLTQASVLRVMLEERDEAHTAFDASSQRVIEAQARAQAAETELSALKALWKWLGDQVDLELSWGDDAEEEGSWQVHRVSGSRSDLAWELIASGPTPLEAVQSARSLLSEAKGLER